MSSSIFGLLTSRLSGTVLKQISSQLETDEKANKSALREEQEKKAEIRVHVLAVPGASCARRLDGRGLRYIIGCHATAPGVPDGITGSRHDGGDH